MHVVNRSGYHTLDLVRFLRKACEAMGARTDKVFVILPSKTGYTRGCAEVGPNPLGGKESKKVAIEIAPPSRFTIGKFAKIAQHEILHTMGITHERMTRNEYWSLGACPEWARREKIRYKGTSRKVLR